MNERLEAIIDIEMIYDSTFVLTVTTRKKNNQRIDETNVKNFVVYKTR